MGYDYRVLFPCNSKEINTVVKGVNTNQDQIWCVNIWEYMVFGVHRGF